MNHVSEHTTGVGNKRFPACLYYDFKGRTSWKVIEKNMEIIHREDFDKVNIADEDVIEILHFVGGGQF